MVLFYYVARVAFLFSCIFVKCPLFVTEVAGPMWSSKLWQCSLLQTLIHVGLIIDQVKYLYLATPKIEDIGEKAGSLK